MKILLINTNDAMGGAAIACKRLYESLLKENISVKMLVQEKSVTQTENSPKIEELAKSWFQKKMAFVRFSLERLYFTFSEKSKEVRFAFSPANIGVDISKHPLVLEADIIHLHWINFGFLSLDSIQKLLATGKPIVWTLHDMWAFTGGCHHSGTCENYQKQCGNCLRFLKKPAPNDLSFKIISKKSTIFKNHKISIVACSQWLENRAKKSSLFHQKNVLSIPNPLDTELFKLIDKSTIQLPFSIQNDTKYILFAAAKISVIWKGFSYFIEALNILKSEYIDQKSAKKQNIELIILGEAEDELMTKLPFKTHVLGRVNEVNKIIEIYNIADIFVIPSLEENLPNTIMEAMACGTPVVGFETGGIPEMIEHKKNGFLAKYKSAEDLAKGIYWTLFESNYEQLSENARKKVTDNYDEKVVTTKYIKLYKQALTSKN